MKVKSSLLIALIISCSQQALAVKVNNNSGPPTEFLTHSMANIREAFSESNIFIPNSSIASNHLSGTFHNDSKSGFTIIVRSKGKVEPKIELYFQNYKISKELNGKITCSNGRNLCQTIGSFSYQSEKITNEGVVHTLSLNSQLAQVGQWEYMISNISSDTSYGDVIISFEDGYGVKVYPENPFFALNRDANFTIEILKPTTEKNSTGNQAVSTLLSKHSLLSISSSLNVIKKGQAVNGHQYKNAYTPVKIDKDGTAKIKTMLNQSGENIVVADVEALLSNGSKVNRTVIFPIVIPPDTSDISSIATTKILDRIRIEIDLEISKPPQKRYALVYAEVWTNNSDEKPKPISWISGMSQSELNAARKPVLSLILDARWMAISKAVSHKLRLKNVRIQDPNTFAVLAQKDFVDITLSSLPSSVYQKASEIEIDDDLLKGFGDISIDDHVVNESSIVSRNSTTKNRSPSDGGILLVHGYCDNNSAWPHAHFDDGPTERFNNASAGISNNAFALEILNQANSHFSDWFSVVAHSQGGMAATHLHAFYQSHLGHPNIERIIQTVGTPYQGNQFMDFYYFDPIGWIVNLFNLAPCEPVFELTTLGAFLWRISIPTTTAKKVHYYRTTHRVATGFFDHLQFWRWKCGISSYFLLGRDDGVVTTSKGHFGRANSHGVTRGQCHTEGYRYMDQKDDISRNEIMDKKGRPNVNCDPAFCGSGDLIEGDDYVCAGADASYTFINPAGVPILWQISPNLQMVNSNGTSVAVRPYPGVSRESGFITADVGGRPIRKDIWIGKPVSPTSLSGPQVVRYGAIVRYYGSSVQGAASYKWYLPYPYDSHTQVTTSPNKWGILSGGNSRQMNAIVGPADGLVQFMGKNKCGIGGAKTMRVQSSTNSGDGAMP